MATTSIREPQHTGPGVYLLMLFMGIAWGLSLAFAKMAATHGGHPLGLAFWQVCVSSAMLLVGLTLTRRLPSLGTGIIRFSLICGITGVAFPAFALFLCARYLPAGVVAIAFASMPLFTYGWSVLFGVEAAEIRRFLGVITGLTAIMLLVIPDSALPSPDLAPWVLLAISASLSMSFENFYAGGYRPRGLSSMQLSCGRQSGAVVVLAPIVFMTANAIPLFEPWGIVQWAATGTGVLSGAAFTMLLYVIRTSGPVFASQSAYIITLAGVAWGMLLFNERHSVYIWAALALTLIAITMVRPRLPRSRRLIR